jgi:hypothetical protein
VFLKRLSRLGRRTADGDVGDGYLARKTGRFALPVVIIGAWELVPRAAIQSVLKRPQPMADKTVIGGAEMVVRAEGRTMCGVVVKKRRLIALIVVPGMPPVGRPQKDVGGKNECEGLHHPS